MKTFRAAVVRSEPIWTTNTWLETVEAENEEEARKLFLEGEGFQDDHLKWHCDTPVDDHEWEIHEVEDIEEVTT